MTTALTVTFASQSAPMMRFSWVKAFMKLTPIDAPNVLATMIRRNAKRCAPWTVFLLE